MLLYIILFVHLFNYSGENIMKLYWILFLMSMLSYMAYSATRYVGGTMPSNENNQSACVFFVAIIFFALVGFKNFEEHLKSKDTTH